MKLITQLPAGDWKIIIWKDCIIAACPEHEPRLIDVDTGTVTVIDGDAFSFIRNEPE